MKQFLIALSILFIAAFAMKRARPESMPMLEPFESKKFCREWNPEIGHEIISTNLEHIKVLLRLTRSIDVSGFLADISRADNSDIEALMMELVGSNMASARLVFSIRPMRISEQLYHKLSLTSEDQFQPGDERLFKHVDFEITVGMVYHILNQGCPDWFLKQSLKHMRNPNLPFQILHLAIFQNRRRPIILGILKRIPQVSVDDLYFACRNSADNSIIEAIRLRISR